MQKTREEYIKDIRARIPYMSDEDLSYVYSLIGVLDHYGYSSYEAERPVLTQDQQHQADRATNCMYSIADAILKGGYRLLQGQACAADGENVLCAVDGNIVIVDAKMANKIYRDTWGIRVKGATLFSWMEDAGYILQRSSSPKTAMLNGERREVLYIPIEQLQHFTEWVSA